MRQKFEALRNALNEFVEQRDALVLVIHEKVPGDLVYPLKYLDEMKRGTRRDIVLLFTHGCLDVTEYVDAMMATCELDVDAGNALIRAGEASEGAIEWDGLPAACFEQALSPLERIEALVRHTRRYCPDPVNRIVLSLITLEGSDPDAYAELVRGLIPWDGFAPWQAGVRIIAHDPQTSPRLVPELAERDAFGTVVMPIDFTPPALTQALAENAANPSAPREERVTSLMQLAALDHSYGRIEEAIRKYAVAYRHYQLEGDRPMQGAALLYTGYAIERAGQSDVAATRYRQALSLALEAESKPLMLNCYLALGGLHQRREEWSDAALYWKAAALLGKNLQHVVAMVEALYYGGQCQIALNDEPTAIEMWTIGQELARKIEYWARAVQLLEALVFIERRRGMDDDASEHERLLEVARAKHALQEKHSHQAAEIVQGEAS